MTAANGFKCLQCVFHMLDEIEENQVELGKLRSKIAVLHSEVKSVKFELDKAKTLITEQSEKLRLKEIDATLLQSVRSEVDLSLSCLLLKQRTILLQLRRRSSFGLSICGSSRKGRLIDGILRRHLLKRKSWMICWLRRQLSLRMKRWRPIST